MLYLPSIRAIRNSNMMHLHSWTHIQSHNTRLPAGAVFGVESVRQTYFAIFKRSGGAISLVASVEPSIFLTFSIPSRKYPNHYLHSTLLFADVHEEYAYEQCLKCYLVPQVLL